MQIHIHIDHNDKPVREAVNRLLKAGTDLSPALRDIGEDILHSSKERFISQQDPKGRPWHHPLSAVTLARKRKNRDKILTERGYLRGTLAWQLAGKNSVDIGSPMIYANTHQFGATRGRFGVTKRGAPIPWGDVPARPFLGVSTDDVKTIQDTINDFFSKQL